MSKAKNEKLEIMAETLMLEFGSWQLPSAAGSFDTTEPINTSGRGVLLGHGMRYNHTVWKNSGTLDYLTELGIPSIAYDVPGEMFKQSEATGPDPEDPAVFMEELVVASGLHRAVNVFVSLSSHTLALPTLNSNPKLFHEGLILIGPVGFTDLNSLPLEDCPPTLLVRGEHDDKFFARPQMLDLARKFGNPPLLATVRNTGHNPYEDNSAAFNRLLADFVSDPQSTVADHTQLEFHDDVMIERIDN